MTGIPSGGTTDPRFAAVHERFTRLLADGPRLADHTRAIALSEALEACL